MNDLARHGIELTAWPCEGSTRQQFYWNKKREIVVSGHDWLGNPTTSCISNTADASFLGVTLADCTLKSVVATYNMIESTKNETAGYVKFVQFNDTVTSMNRCLVLQKLKNNGGAYGPRGGAQILWALQ